MILTFRMHSVTFKYLEPLAMCTVTVTPNHVSKTNKYLNISEEFVSYGESQNRKQAFVILNAWIITSCELKYSEDMLPALLVLLRSYAPYVTLPISIAIGYIGYNIEGLISDKFTPTQNLSTKEERLERQLEEMENNDSEPKSLKSKSFVPKTMFERNIS